jgi:hypothetical protein
MPTTGLDEEIMARMLLGRGGLFNQNISRAAKYALT